jgi:hypothetical protein
VYRNLDNRKEGLSDDSPRALELHILRKKALHDVFDKADNVAVKDWDLTDDAEPHEYVELVVVAAITGASKFLVEAALKHIGEKLAEKAVDETTNWLVRWLISKLKPKQKKKEILDYVISIQQGTWVHVIPQETHLEITTKFNDRPSEQFTVPY